MAIGLIDPRAARMRRVFFPVDQLELQNRRALTFALDRTANEITSQIRGAINRENPFPHDNPSRPGEPPKKRTGFLHDSTQAIRQGLRNIVVRVPQYGIWLDGGTSKMDARPFIRVNVHNQSRRWLNRIKDLHNQFVRLESRAKRRK